MPDNDKPKIRDDLSEMTDEQLLQQARADRAYFGMAIEDGLDIDPQLLVRLDAQIKKFEDAVRKEKIAIQNAKIAAAKVARAADAVLTAYDQHDKSRGTKS